MLQAVNRETELVAEDEQAFLARLQQISFGGAAAAGTRLGESPMRPNPMAGRFFYQSYFT